MPRRRSISPEFFKDEDLATLPFEARLLFQGLWCYADRDGRLEDRPKYLKAELFAYDRVDVDKFLSLLANPQIPDRPTKVFIQRYTVETRQYIEITEFVKHQRPHPQEHSNQFPDPPLNLIANNYNLTHAKTNTKDQLKDQGPRTKDQSAKVKQPYGEFKNVLLTEDERGKLVAKFGATVTDSFIERVSRYVESKGKKYKSHYATILEWAAKDDNSKPVPPAPQSNWGKTVTAKEVWFCGCYRNDPTPCKSPDHGKTYEEVMAQ